MPGLCTATLIFGILVATASDCGATALTIKGQEINITSIIDPDEIIGRIDNHQHHHRKNQISDGFVKYGKDNKSIPVFYAENGESWTVKCPLKKSLTSRVIWSQEGEILVHPYTRVNVEHCEIYCECSSLYVAPNTFDLSIEHMMSDIQGTFTCVSGDKSWSFFLIVRGHDKCHPNKVFYICIAAFVVVLLSSLLFVCCITWSEKSSKSAQDYLTSGHWQQPAVNFRYFNSPQMLAFRKTYDSYDQEFSGNSHPNELPERGMLPRVSPRSERRVSM
ncbi:uncharacterized protein LOC132205525 [Neocloeon triangulifer]|uniref:uncharacterized protein LOC132205525 n=1 Tax=Neocloeon triangulifer TaxID=2078957 RepID=UPI00286F3AA1|nr:uncharacterized protein LOC132205525 [Neocloeon triangulifer]